MCLPELQFKFVEILKKLPFLSDFYKYVLKYVEHGTKMSGENNKKEIYFLLGCAGSMFLDCF